MFKLFKQWRKQQKINKQRWTELEGKIYYDYKKDITKNLRKARK